MKVTTDACLFGAWVADEMQEYQTTGKHALDIGTGTGLLSLMVAQKQMLCIDALEIDEEAAKQADENVAASPWKEKIKVIAGDASTTNFSKRYHYIFSNPPFYENEIRSQKIAKNIAHHNAGLTLEKLFAFVQNQLMEDGHFFLLLPAKRETEFPALFKRYGFQVHKKLVAKQTCKHQPFRLLLRGSRTPVKNSVEDEIVIKDEAGQYTPAFTSLLKDYYLYL